MTASLPRQESTQPKVQMLYRRRRCVIGWGHFDNLLHMWCEHSGLDLSFEQVVGYLLTSEVSGLDGVNHRYATSISVSVIVSRSCLLRSLGCHAGPFDSVQLSSAQ
jgi:hypothetical protein